MNRLVVSQVGKEYPTRAEPLVVLRDISFELSSGQTTAVLGPSGSGKSTLLHILGTLETPTSGTVTLDGLDPFALDEPALARFRHDRIGFVFQDHHLLPQCSALENVLIPGLATGGVDAALVARARSLLDRVGLSQRLRHRPSELSGGERQRTAIARALINRPALLLADEPTGNLDRTSAAQVAGLLLELQSAEGAMLIVVTHSQDLANEMQRQVTLDDGRLKIVPAASSSASCGADNR
jgi:lipoprotein-releasing system ATP-binding protein